MITKDELGKKIRELRIKAGLSQDELGKALKRSHATISGIERGKTELTISDLSLIADCLSTPITDFLGLETAPKLFTTSIRFKGTVSDQNVFDGYTLNIVDDQNKINSSERPTTEELPTPTFNKK